LLIFRTVCQNAVVDVDSIDLLKSRLDNFCMFQDVKYDTLSWVDLASTWKLIRVWHWKLLKIVVVFQEQYKHQGSASLRLSRLLIWL